MRLKNNRVKRATRQKPQRFHDPDVNLGWEPTFSRNRYFRFLLSRSLNSENIAGVRSADIPISPNKRLPFLRSLISQQEHKRIFSWFLMLSYARKFRNAGGDYIRAVQRS